MISRFFVDITIYIFLRFSSWTNINTTRKMQFEASNPKIIVRTARNEKKRSKTQPKEESLNVGRSEVKVLLHLCEKFSVVNLPSSRWARWDRKYHEYRFCPTFSWRSTKRRRRRNSVFFLACGAKFSVLMAYLKVSIAFNDKTPDTGLKLLHGHICESAVTHFRRQKPLHSAEYPSERQKLHEQLKERQALR